MINVAYSSDIQVRLCAGIDVVVGCCLYMSNAQRWQNIGFDKPPAPEHTPNSVCPSRKTYKVGIVLEGASEKLELPNSV